MMMSTFIFFSMPSAISENVSSVKISEVQMNPEGSDTGAEFVELMNTSNEVQDISGWDLDAADLPYFTFPAGSIIQRGSVLTIYFRKEGVNTSDTIYTGGTFGSTNMKNTNGAVALFNSQVHTNVTIMDYMEYGNTGQTHEAIAIERNLWISGNTVPVSGQEGLSVMRICQRNTELACWKYATATPGQSTLEDIAHTQENSNTNSSFETNQNSNETINAVESIVLIHNEIFSGDSFLSESPVSIKITSSGSVLFVDEGNGPHALDQGIFEKYIVEEGEYTFSYFNSSDESNVKSVKVIYRLPDKIIYPYINEVSFNAAAGNKDFLELYAPQIENLKDFALRIDQVTIALDDLPINEGYAVVSFGGMRAELAATMQKQVNTPSSLVGTTEQISLLYKDNPIDGVCWEIQPISSTEVSDYEKFTGENGIWNGSCFDAHLIPSGASLVRKERGAYPLMRLSNDLWESLLKETPGKANILEHSAPSILIQVQGDGRLSGNAPFHLNLSAEGSSDVYGIVSYFWDYGDGTFSDVVNPLDHVYTSPGSFDVTLKVVNILGDLSTKTLHIDVLPTFSTGSGGNTTLPSAGDCASDEERHVMLSEVFPNPKGTDTGSEWIELYNPTDKDIVFCDLFLDDVEGGSEPFRLKGKTVAAKNYIVLPDTETKIVLGNTADSVRLLYGEDREIIDSVDYQNVKEGMSYSRF